MQNFILGYKRKLTFTWLLLIWLRMFIDLHFVEDTSIDTLFRTTRK